MAITALNPDPGPQSIPDPVSFEEAALLLRETELPEFTRSSVKNLGQKLYRWAKEDQLPMQPRVGGKRGELEVSYSDLLVAHATRYPAPGARRP